MKKNLFTLLLLLGCTFLFHSACRKDLVPTKTNGDPRTFTIAEAKDHFNGQYGAEIPGLPGSADSARQKRPQWDGAQQRTLKSGSPAVLVPLHKPGTYVQLTEKKMARFGFLNYLMMYKDSTGRIITEWVVLKPSVSWLSSSTARPFDGNILVKDWNGRVKKLYSYDHGGLLSRNVRRSSNVKAHHLARTSGDEQSGDEEPGGGDDPGGDQGTVPCLVTQTITFSTTPKNCPCENHTYEQINLCKCPEKPQPGYNTNIEITYEIECDPGPDDPPIGGGGGDGGDDEEEEEEGGNNGGSGGGDYPPLSCNPDPDYVMPTTPPPPGTDYILPCDELEIPMEDFPVDGGIDFLSPAEKLVEFYNNDPDPAYHLGSEESSWLHAHPYEVGELLKAMRSESEETKGFGRWAILHLTQTDGADFDIFRNHHLSRFAEGLDGTPDPSSDGYWDDPNLTVAAQPLPTLAQFSAAFPKKSNGGPMESSEVINLIGGQVLTSKNANPAAFGNACALRVSRGLNYSGVTIPAISGQTLTGADGKNYFYRAAQLLGWMKRAFPAPTQITGAQGGPYGSNFKTLLANKPGIYIMTPNYPGKFGASGHADYWNGTTCISDCYFSEESGVNMVYLWRLF